MLKTENKDRILMSEASFDSEASPCASRRTKAPPQGALEEAVALFDALYEIVLDHREGCDGLPTADLAELERRRAALEPRLAKRRDNQAKGRGGKP